MIKNSSIQTRAYWTGQPSRRVCASSQVSVGVWVYARRDNQSGVSPIPADRTLRTIHSNPFILSARILRPELWCDPHLVTAWREQMGTWVPHWRPWVPSRLDTKAWGQQASMMRGPRLQSWLFCFRQGLNLTTPWFLHLKTRDNNTHLMFVMNIKNKMDSASHEWEPMSVCYDWTESPGVTIQHYFIK